MLTREEQKIVLRALKVFNFMPHCAAVAEKLRLEWGHPRPGHEQLTGVIFDDADGPPDYIIPRCKVVPLGQD